LIGVLGALLAGLLQLATGLLLAAVWRDYRGDVTRGFLALCAVTALATAALAVALAGLLRVDGSERTLQIALSVLIAGYTILLVSERRAPRLVLGVVGGGIGLASLVLAAFDRPSAALGALPTVVAFLLGASALGSAIGGMLLGHWYLVTPKLTSRPLRQLCDALLVSLVPLTGLAVWFITAGSGAGASDQGIGGLSGAMLWVGAGMITLFPFGVTIAARVCCVDGPGRGRSLQAATGLLYLVAAAVLAGGLAGNAVLLGS
jgi:hypothetical protein